MEESLRIWLEDEAGQDHEYELIGVFGFEEKDYMVLQEVHGEERSEEVFLVGFHGGPEDEIIFDPIEDDEEYRRVSKVYDDIFRGGMESYDLYMQDSEEQTEEAERMLQEMFPDGIPEELLIRDSLEQDSQDEPDWDDEDEWCYEDADGNLFIYGEDGRVIYLDENGEPIPEPEGRK